jgi:hypothetical protein
MSHSSGLRSVAFTAFVSLLFMIGGSSSAGAQTISFVQSNYAVPQTPQSTVAVRYAAVQNAGDLNVAVIGWNDVVSHVVSVTDTSGNLYALAVGPTAQPGVQTQAIYYAANISAAAANANTVMVTFDRPADFPDVRIAEYSGVASVSPVDVARGASGSGGTSDSGAVVTTNANVLLVAANYVQTLTVQGGAGFTTRLITTPDGNVVQDRIVTAAGSYGATASLTGTRGWVMQLVAFRAASGTPGGGEAPGPPRDVAATARANNQIHLSWSAPGNNHSVTRYEVERCQGAGCTTFTQIAITAATNHIDTGLAAATSYSYRVRAVDTAGHPSAYSTTASATTPGVTTPITFVQSNYAVPQTPQSTVTVPFTSMQTAGDLNVVVVGWSDTTTEVQSVTDRLGNAYVRAVGPTIQPGVATQSIYYARNIAAATANANAVTVMFTAAARYADIRIAEYGGLDPLTPVEATAASQGSGTTSSSGSLATSSATALLVAANKVQTVTTAPGSGFTSRVITSPNGDILEDRVVTAAGSYSGSAAVAGGAWILQMVAFRGAGDGPSLPTITSLNPASGVVGTTVTIGGANFGATPGASTVTFNGTAASPTSWGATSIVAPVPAGATSGNVFVTVGGQTSNGVSFTVVTSSQPTITGLNPTSGSVGTPVTITGANFGTTQGSSTVTFNGTAAVATSWSLNRIVASVPDGATTGIVVVRVNGQVSNGVMFTVVGRTTVVYPLKASPNGRYLVDQNNVPVLLVGDTAHALSGKASEAQVADYFANRGAYHFNSVVIYAPCGAYVGCNGDGSTFDGIRPFTIGDSPSTYDLSTPNEVYFSRVDRLVNAAAAYGLTVLLDPVETGDFLETLRYNGPTKAFDYGVYVGTRYRNFANIIWLQGEDFQTWETSSTDNHLVAQVMAGIASADSNHLQTIQLNYQRSYSNQDSADLRPYLTLDLVYTYYETYDYMLAAYHSSPTIPAFLGEANYEDENNTSQLPDVAGPKILRQQIYWALLSGGSGHFFGNGAVNHTHPDWQDHLDTPAVRQVPYATNLFTSYHWWNLVPDQTHQVVIAGYGTYDADNQNLTTSDYVTATWIDDGSLAMAYCPTSTTLTVDLTRFARPIVAKWYDPATGTFLAVAGSPFRNSGTHQFVSPGANGDGNTDWVLVLDATLATLDTEPPTVR